MSPCPQAPAVPPCSRRTGRSCRPASGRSRPRPSSPLADVLRVSPRRCSCRSPGDPDVEPTLTSRAVRGDIEAQPVRRLDRASILRRRVQLAAVAADGVDLVGRRPCRRSEAGHDQCSSRRQDDERFLVCDGSSVSASSDLLAGRDLDVGRAVPPSPIFWAVPQEANCIPCAAPTAARTAVTATAPPEPSRQAPHESSFRSVTPRASATGLANACRRLDEACRALATCSNGLFPRVGRCFATQMANGEVEFRVLGPLEVASGGELLALGGAKQRAVLAVLLLRAGEVVPLDRLVDEVWGNDPPPSAAHTLESYVSRLRQLLNGSGGSSRAAGRATRST